MTEYAYIYINNKRMQHLQYKYRDYFNYIELQEDRVPSTIVSVVKSTMEYREVLQKET